METKKVLGLTALRTYRLTRFSGLSPRNAAFCVLMRFSGSRSEFSYRANNATRVLNANDREKGLIK